MLSVCIYTVATCILSTRMTFYYIIHNPTHWEDLAGTPIPTMPMNFAVLGSGWSTQSPIRNPLSKTLISSCWKYQASFRLLVPMSALARTDPQCRIWSIAPTQVPMQPSLCPEALHIFIKVVVVQTEFLGSCGPADAPRSTTKWRTSNWRVPSQQRCGTEQKPYHLAGGAVGGVESRQ